MSTVERRIAALEQHNKPTGPLLLPVDDPLTDEQRRDIEEAERIGRFVLLMTPIDAAL